MMVRLQFAVIFFFGWVSHTLAAICPCVEQKIWYNHGLGLTPDIRVIKEMVENAPGPPDENVTCLPNFDMKNHKKTLEYFYSLHFTMFVAPQTGTYTFYMACDNTCVLCLTGKYFSFYLWLFQYTGNYEYDKYPANQTAPYNMTKGECLNITVIQAEGEIADHVTIKVEYPDGTEDSPMSKHICDKCPCEDSDPCIHGTCITTGDAPDGLSCDCLDCYEGANCSAEIHNCDDDTCKNGGICKFDPQQASCYACDCPECYAGDTCEIEIDPCDSNPCQHDGTCHPDSTKPDCYYCECTKCFLGSKNCETPVDNCRPNNPCQNGGTCTFFNDDDKCYKCSCTPCWEGDNCEKRRNYCYFDTCDNDGICSWVDDGNYCYYCNCTDCYEGRICEIPVNKCNPNPCENGGTCKFENDDDCYKCYCTPCWTGTNCTIKRNKCKPDPCQNGGTCSWVDDKDKCYKCKCPVCYDGENCQNEVDNCKPNPCKNGGTCKFVNDSKLCYECDCAPCWTGPTCEDETKCWFNHGVQCQEADCKPPEVDVKNHCPNNCKCCVEPGCYDTGENCMQRCRNINAGNVGLLSKECRRSCDFCCPCEGKCDLMFQKKGCWRDKIKRKLGTLVLYERNTPFNWAGWNNYLPNFVCRCAKAAANAGFRFFGVQFYRECWAGNNWFYDNSGLCTSRNKPCIDRGWHECTWPDRQEEQETPPHYCCAGKNDCNYVYEIPVNQKVDPCHLLE